MSGRDMNAQKVGQSLSLRTYKPQDYINFNCLVNILLAHALRDSLVFLFYYQYQSIALSPTFPDSSTWDPW